MLARAVRGSAWGALRGSSSALRPCSACDGVVSRGLAATTVDSSESAKFAADASLWWKESGGPFALLHAMNPVRCAFIRAALCNHFGLDPQVREPLSGLRLLDVGCGGGLLCAPFRPPAATLAPPPFLADAVAVTSHPAVSHRDGARRSVEPLTRMGASVTGIDAVDKSITIARLHAALDPAVQARSQYRTVTAEQLVAEGATFDAVLSLEVVEHVADVELFVASLGALVRPGGAAVVSTVNRTLRSFALGVVAAERVLGWVPAGTHDWSKFLKPEELTAALSTAGLELDEISGLVYNPLRGSWALGSDLGLGYIAYARKAEEGVLGKKGEAAAGQ